MSDRYRIQVLDRLRRSWTASDSIQRVERQRDRQPDRLHKSTTHRILMALEYNRLIKQNPETGKYHLGIKLFKLGNQAVLAIEFARHLPAAP